MQHVSHVEPAAVVMAFKVLNNVFRQFKAELKDANLTSAIEQVAVYACHFLGGSDSKAYLKSCNSLVFPLVYDILGIQKPNYKLFMRDDLPLGRLSLLSYAAKKGEKVENMEGYMVELMEKHVLNDKMSKPLALRNVSYFALFLQNAESQLVEEKIHSQIEFIMNRSSKFIGVVASVISQLTSYTLTSLEKWTTQLLSDESLFSLERQSSVKFFLASVFELCRSEELKTAFAKSFLMGKFNESVKSMHHLSTIEK